MKRLKQITILQRHDLLGLILGWLVFWASLRPSLLPRAWYLQVIICAVVIAIAYGVGALLSRSLTEVIGKYKDRFYKKPSHKVMRVIYVLGFAIVIYQLVESSLWQYETYRLIGQEPPQLLWLHSTVIVGVGALILSQALIAAGVAVGRGVRWLYKKALYSKPIQRLPEGIFQSGVALVVLVLIALILNGVITRGVGLAVYNIYDTRNDRYAASPYDKPTNPLLSGSDESLIAWDKLGYQGRKFIAGGPSQSDIEKTIKQDAIQPVRVYLGKKGSQDIKEQSKLAIKEMQRTGAFSRKAIQIIVTTGTGWTSPKDTRALEYIMAGDVASVAIQYSFLPSWISFMADQQQAKQAGYQLVGAVLDHVKTIPKNERPEIYLFGESLGSYGAEYVYMSHPDLAENITGALFVGPPGINVHHQHITKNRQPGSPSYKPVYENGRDTIFITDRKDIDEVKYRPSVIYLQNPTDPVTKLNAELLWSKPDWVEEQKLEGHIAERFTWRPIVTFFQVAMDSVFALKVPTGYGHHYGSISLDTWLILTDVELSEEQIESIRKVI